MKKKIVILGSFLLCLVTLSNAQKSSAILRGGVNFANISINDDGGTNDAKSLTSFQVGVLGDFHLVSFLSLQPGLVFTGKGTKTESGTEGGATWYKSTTNPYYLEIPVNLVFKTPTAPVRFFAGAGPYLGIGIAGKNKVKGSFLGASFNSEESIDWSDDDPTTLDYEENAGYGRLRRFDYGLNGTLGIEASGLVISANYGLGLAKVQSGTDSDDDNNNKHRVFSITVGFRL